MSWSSKRDLKIKAKSKNEICSASRRAWGGEFFETRFLRECASGNKKSQEHPLSVVPNRRRRGTHRASNPLSSCPSVQWVKEWMGWARTGEEMCEERVSRGSKICQSQRGAKSAREEREKRGERESNWFKGNFRHILLPINVPISGRRFAGGGPWVSPSSPSANFSLLFLPKICTFVSTALDNFARFLEFSPHFTLGGKLTFY